MKVQKLCFWLILLLFHSSFATADVKIQDGKISAQLNSAPLTQVLQAIKEQAQIRLDMEQEIGSKTVTASFQDLSLGDGIRKMLEGTGINFVVLSDGEGRPSSLFVGISASPGAPARRLDSRPINNNRGVVTPVNPQQQQPPQQQPIPPSQPGEERQNAPRRQAPAVNVPTGGGFNPAATQPEQDRQQQQQQQDEIIPEEEQQEEQ